MTTPLSLALVATRTDRPRFRIRQMPAELNHGTTAWYAVAFIQSTPVLASEFVTTWAEAAQWCRAVWEGAGR